MRLKSLFFGSAAVLAAGTGAQAADLPVVEPVEYVRICDAFGTGFYYIPGTDTCLRVAGRVRVDSYYVPGDNDFKDAVNNLDELFSSSGAFFKFDDGEFGDVEFFGNDDKEFNNWSSRARGYIRLDARTQTDIGLVRAYISYIMTVGPNGPSFDTNYSSTGSTLEEAFIQISNNWGTYTAGHTASFFDFYGANAYNADFTPLDIGAVDDPTGEQTLWAWTFAGGNGFSATLSIEDPASGGRRYSGTSLDLDFDDDDDDLKDLGFASDEYEGQEFPDFVGNIRVDQGWGSAQLSGVLHGIHDIGADDDDDDDDDDGDFDDTALGWAIAGGLSLTIPAPMELSFNTQVTYGHGATGYVSGDPFVFGDWFEVNLDTDEGESKAWDKNSAWSIRAGVSIGLTPTLTAHIDGSYTEISLGDDFDDDDDDDFDFDFDDDDDDDLDLEYSMIGLAADLVWNPVSGLTIGPEISYKRVEFSDGIEDLLELKDEVVFDDDDDDDDLDDDIFGIMWRIQRDF
jgi:hypothetical protein